MVYFPKTDYCIILSYYLQLIFTKQIIALFCVIIYSYLRRFFKIDVLKTFYTICRKQLCRHQPVACYLFNKRLQHRYFLVNIAKLSRTPFLQEHLETPDSVYMEHIYNYNIIKFKVACRVKTNITGTTKSTTSFQTSFFRRREDVLFGRKTL